MAFTFISAIPIYCNTISIFVNFIFIGEFCVYRFLAYKQVIFRYVPIDGGSVYDPSAFLLLLTIFLILFTQTLLLKIKYFHRKKKLEHKGLLYMFLEI